MADFRSDIRSAFRGLGRTPTVTISAIICVALGVGAITAISSAVSRALLRGLPFADADRLVAVHRVTPHSGPDGTWPHSAPNYIDLSQRSHQITSLAALQTSSALIIVGDKSERVPQVRATGNLFATLGVRAQRGRLFGVTDDATGAPLVVLISDRFWRTKLGADSAIVGTKMILDGEPTTIVGVLPREFEIQLANGLFKGDVWSPIRFTQQQLAEDARNSNFLTVIGRLVPKATQQSAQTELQTIFSGIVQSHPDFKGENVRVAMMDSDSVKNVRTPLWLLFGAVCIVLLISTTNVAALLLARGVERQRETAVRVALGGGRNDVMRPVFVESLLLALIGTAFGIALAAVGTRFIGALAAARMPQLAGLQIDVRVLGFAILISILVGLACAIVPAWRSAGVDPQDALRGGRGGGASRSQTRSLRLLVIGEIGLSLVLLIGAGLVLKAFAQLVQRDPGFNPAHVLSFNVTLSPANYKDRPAEVAFMAPAATAIAAIPGVEAVGAINTPPYINWGNNFNIQYEGQSRDEQSKLPIVEYRRVTPTFFGVTQQKLLAGRLLSSRDNASAISVVVVNKTLIDRDFKGKDAIGKRFHVSDTSFATIVGVVTDIRNAGPFADPKPEVYWTYEQSGSGTTSYPIFIRVAGTTPTSVATAVRSAIHAIDPTAAVSEFRPMNEVIDQSLGQPKFYLAMLGAFAVVAVLLSVSGLYGTLSYTVAQRTRELGIRAALGSSRRRLIGIVTAQGLRLIVGGLVIGLIGGWATTRLMAFMLYGVSPLDPVAWIASSVALAVAATLATLIPAMRAARADPLIAIRNE